MLHDVCRYVPGFSSEAIERATDLDGGAHKKTGHKRCTTIPQAILSRPTPILP